MLKEEVDLAGNVERGLIGVNDDAARDNINGHLAVATSCSCITPYVALERVRKVLAAFHIMLPQLMFLDGDHGVETVQIKQFGNIMGVTNTGEVVTKVDYPYHLYFEYQRNEFGMYDVFCEIVNEEELKELLSDVEDELQE